jgi:hypothetical protein
MLSDPLSITYNSVAKSLPRASISMPGIRKRLSAASYSDSATEFFARTEQSSLGNGGWHASIILGRTNPDTDPDPMMGSRLTNYFGLVYGIDQFRANTSVDIPLLRTALLSFVDSTMQNRLVGGEY